MMTSEIAAEIAISNLMVFVLLNQDTKYYGLLVVSRWWCSVEWQPDDGAPVMRLVVVKLRSSAERRLCAARVDVPIQPASDAY